MSVTLHPALRLVRARHPVLTIWQMNQPGADPSPLPMDQPQDVLILRPDFDPVPQLLPPGGGAFMAQLLSGAPLIDALSATPPDFNLAAVLTMLVNGRAITGLAS